MPETKCCIKCLEIKNLEYFRLYNKNYNRINSKEICAKKKIYREDNIHKIYSLNASRRFSKMNATPKWSNIFFIQEAYALAKLRTKLTGIKWHVDHIVPLKSKLVCGLHCEANLQVITASQNSSKRNYHWPNMPEFKQAS